MAKQMDENDNTGRISVIVRIQNNTERKWSEIKWSDVFDDGYPYDIDRRLPEFTHGGFTLHPGSEDQILTKASAGGLGISKGCAGNHTFTDGNGKTITFKWKMPSAGDGKVEWKSNDGSLKNTIYYLDREDGWQVIYFVIKTDGEPINDLTVADSALASFQDVLGFIPIVGDLANTGIYAARGMAKEAIFSALGGVTGAAGKGLSVAAKSVKYASKASKIDKIKKGIKTAEEAGQYGVDVANGDISARDIVSSAATKGMGKASKKMNDKKLKGAQTFDEFKDDISGFAVDVAYGADVGDAAKGMVGKAATKAVGKVKRLDDYKDEISGFAVDVAYGADAGDAAKSAGLKIAGKAAENMIDEETRKKMNELNDLLVSGSKTIDKTKSIAFKTQFGYMVLNSSGYMTITQNKDEATKWNELLYEDNYKQKYYQVASGSWKGYYLSSHWDNGVCVYAKWSDCLYFGYERYRLRCKGGKCDSYSVKFRQETSTFYCYYRSPEYQECIVIKEE